MRKKDYNVKRKKKIDQPEIELAQNTNTDSIIVNVENSVSRGEQSSEHSPKPMTSYRYLSYCLLFVCLAPVAYGCVTVATFAFLPFLIAASVVIRVIQFVIIGDDFEKHFLPKFILRYWTFVVIMSLLLELGLFYPFAKYVPQLKLVMIVGLPLTKWIKIACLLIGIYILSQVIWLSIAYMLVGKDESGPVILEAVSEITGCLLFWWAEVVVMNSIPTFKDSKILTLYTHQWIKVSLFVVIGYDVITLLTHILVLALMKFNGDHLGVSARFMEWLLLFFCEDVVKRAFSKKYVVYVASGIKRSVIFILSSLLLLLTWSLYFGKHLKKTSQHTGILEFGTKTLVSILVCSFLWLIKSSVLLYWEAHAVYDRLQSKITYISKQLYFLVLLSHSQFLKVVEQSTDGNSSLCCAFMPSKKKSLWVLLYSDSEGGGSQVFNRKIVRETLINRTVPDASIYDIQQAGMEPPLGLSCGLSLRVSGMARARLWFNIYYLQEHVPEENNVNVTQILKNIIQGAGEDYWGAGEDYWEDDWKILRHLLVHTTEEISFQKVKTWMERAHNRCMFLANTLISEKEVVRCLNQVISWLIIGATLIMWLLLTGLASTNVLILLASPLLAATFIFGDTCKSLFQGLMFVYVAHPFDVGDLCVIDEKMVKRIGVWSTTFSKVRTVGKQEEVIYPNSELITKNLINHKTEFDWKDYVEFTPSSTDKEIRENVIQDIKKYLDTQEEKFTPNFHSVEFLEIGDSVKVRVHIKYCAKTEGWTFFECLKEKEKRRVEFALYVQELLNQQSIT